MMFLVLLLCLIAALPFVIELFRRRMGPGARETAEGQFVTLSNGITHFDWIGPANGPVAVCVHGLTTPSFVWRGIAHGLAAAGYRVLVYDLYGRGYSDRPRGLQDRAFFLNQLSELLESQNISGQITLLGYSMGGKISTAWAASNPSRIRQLIIIASAGIVVSPGRLGTFIRDTPVIGDWLMHAFYPRMHRKGTEEDRAKPSSVENVVERQQNELRYRGFVPAVLSSLRGILRDSAEQDHRALSAAKIPVLAIWGEDDPLIPKSSAGKLAQWNHNSLQEVIDGADHSLAYTHTAQVLNAISNSVPVPEADS